MQVTLCGRIKDKSLYPALDATAKLMEQVERLYFRERFIKHGQPNELKRQFLKEYGITGRQLNGIIFSLAGKVDATKKCLQRNLETKERKLEAVKKRIREALTGKDKDWFKIHQYERQAVRLEDTITKLNKRIASAAPSICFGSRKLFRKQFYLKNNGYHDHDEWLNDWRATRASQFYCLGSKGESFGNQTCQMLSNGLQLRLPNCFTPKFGIHITVPVVFPYGEVILRSALYTGQAINYRFIRKDKGWYVHVTTERVNVLPVTDRKNGDFAVDLKADHLEVGRIEEFGNPVDSWNIDTLLLGKSKTQIAAIVGDAIALVVQYAKDNLVPVVIEDLKLDKKKGRGCKKVNRKVSMITYAAFRKLLLSKAFQYGVEVISINPAYTSVIGWVKFGTGYRLTPHQAAAVAVARRGLGFGERLTARRLRYTLCLPVRNRRRHVWSDWRVVSRMLERSRKSMHSGRRQARSPARGIPLSTVDRSSTPTMDGSPGFRGHPPDVSQQHCSAGQCECITVVVPF